ncbi:MAG: ATP-dependent RecD-like DNA helicase [Eubacteriales bacterium]
MINIEGSVVNIIYTNYENGYTVIDLDVNGELITAVGKLSFLKPGEFVRLRGNWAEHKTFGSQFKVDIYESSLPENLDGIKYYLSSGLIKGVGEVLADRIVERFKLDTFNIIKNDPELLTEIKGISKPIALNISKSVIAHSNVQNIIIWLQEMGISTNQAIKIYEVLGDTTIATIRQNPYILIDSVRDIGFEKADKIASNIGINFDSPFRIQSGIKHVLKSGMEQGHTCLPLTYIKRECGRILKILNEEEILSSINELLVNGDLSMKEYLGKQMVFLSYCYITEADISNRLISILKSPSKIDISDFDKKLKDSIKDITLSREQKNAVVFAVSNNVTIITGGPGTGKTTILNAIINILERSGVTVALCAPTGRAAKRMEETTGRAAKTIHRLLEYDFSSDEDYPIFSRNEENPLDAEVIVVDEASMIDIFLFRSLLKAIKDGSRLIIVGDSDQLPSVGPGNVLSDIISSGIFNTNKLTHFYRQDGRGDIVTAAHAVNEGLLPNLKSNKEFVFLKVPNSTAAIDTLLNEISKAKGTDIQIITPIKRSALGCVNLNELLRNYLNPAKSTLTEITYGSTTFREGDKVMQIKNNYSKEWTCLNKNNISVKSSGIFNGEMGRIISIDTLDQKLHILFDSEREAQYDINELNELEHSYAITVHKSQGSEFDTVILPLLFSKSDFFTRNLLYTAITRAKNKLIIIGIEDCIKHMVNNVDTHRRVTSLRLELNELNKILA